VSAASTPVSSRPIGDPRASAREVARFWWLWLVTGVVWSVAALVILQFDGASITTIGIIIGSLFCFAAVQQLVMAAVDPRLRWLWALIGVLLLVAGLICFLNPEATFVGLADTLGFLFLLVGVWWIVDALVDRGENDLWWLGLTGGILMLIVAFWTSGQFFLEKAYTLLVLAGIWALMSGVSDLMRAFRLRGLRGRL